ncbi:MAG: MFS transporter [Acidimicrobiia bacterium]
MRRIVTTSEPNSDADTELRAIEEGEPAQEPDLGTSLPRAFRALGFRDFRIFWSAAVVSSIGSNMQLAALLWVVAISTRSAARVSLVAFVGVVPLLLLSPLGGALADRFARRHVLAITQALMMIQALVLWTVWISGAGSYWVLFALALTNGMLAALSTPSWQVFVVDLVPRAYLQNAITLNTTQFNVARAVGPLVAGVLIAEFGAGLCFLLNGVSFVFVLLALIALSASATIVPTRPSSRPTVWQGFTDSVRTVRAEPGLVTAIGTHAAFAFFAAPVVQLVPVFAVEALDVGPAAYGVLLGAFGFGAVGIAVAIGSADDRVAPSRILAYGFVLSALAVGGLAVAPTLAPAVGAMVLFGAAYVIVVSIDHSAIQRLADDHNRGRVTSLWLMTFGVFFPIGVLAEGAAAEAFGVRVALGGVAALLVAVLVFVFARRLLPRINPATDASAP